MMRNINKVRETSFYQLFLKNIRFYSLAKFGNNISVIEILIPDVPTLPIELREKGVKYRFV